MAPRIKEIGRAKGLADTIILIIVVVEDRDLDGFTRKYLWIQRPIRRHRQPDTNDINLSLLLVTLSERPNGPKESPVDVLVLAL